MTRTHVRLACWCLGLSIGLGSVAAQAAAPDRTWARTYNAQGLVATLDGPRTDVNDVTHYTYDSEGRVATVTDALGHVTTYESYDSLGHVLKLVDPNQVVTLFTYAPQGWLKTITQDATGTPATTTLEYDEVGDVIATEDPDGIILIYTYDDARRLTDITDADGNRIHYTLDAAGNRLREETFDVSGTLTYSLSRAFNSLGQLLTVTDALNRTVLTYNYPDGHDAAGHPAHVADGAGTERTLAYDGLDRLAGTVDDVDGADIATRDTTTTYWHDANDHLTGITDPDGLTTAYVRDGLGNRTTLQSPDTGTSTDTYDAAGNPLVHVDATGATRTATYDALNRRTGATFSDMALDIIYAYDEVDSVTGCSGSAPVGRLTRIIEHDVTTIYCYDARGNTVEKRQVAGSTIDTLQYTYTAANRLQQLTMPDGTVVSYSFNATGQVGSMAVMPAGGSSGTAVSAITHLPFGPVSGYTLGNGQAVTRTHNATYALTDIISPALNLHVARDAMGRIVAEGDSAGAAPASETYRYDALSRLVEVDDASNTPILSYSYTRTGDRLSKFAGGITDSYSYVIGSHKLNAVGSLPRSSALNGNTTASGTTGNLYGYGYNDRNRLTVVQWNGSTVGTYAYNALGQRIAKTATTPQTTSERFVYDETGHLVGEYGTTHRDYLWMGDIPVAIIDNTVNGSTTTSLVNYVTADHLGTPRAISNSAGVVIWTWAFRSNPFGERPPESATGYVFNLRFPGQYYDAESLLAYNVSRDYEAETGRYVQSDPIGLGGGWSTYAYAGDNPVNNIDPLGLESPATACGGGPGTTAWTNCANAPLTPDLTVLNASIGAGGVLGMVFSASADSGLAFDTRGNVCIYSMLCGSPPPLGINLGSSLGLVAGAGTGALHSGQTQCLGVFRYGGAGVLGEGQILYSEEGDLSVGRAFGGVGEGKGGGVLECQLTLQCLRD